MSELDKLLKAIKQIESSGGIDTEHRTIASGIHEGDAAIGSYGLMPNTIKEIVKRDKEGPYQSLEKLENEELKPVVEAKIPDALRPTESTMEDYLARKLVEHIDKKQEGDKERIAASWLYGHNLPQERAEKLTDTDYVKKVINEYNRLNIPESLQYPKIAASLKKR